MLKTCYPLELWLLYDLSQHFGFCLTILTYGYAQYAGLGFQNVEILY